MTAAAKGSVGGSQLYTKDEATAAQRTWVFHLCKTADQADCTGVVPVVTISKAGGAFGAAVGAVTELANGFYKIVWDAADLDTIGCLAARVAVATADTLDAIHQVIVLDINTATVNPGADGVTAATIAAGAFDAGAFAADAAAMLQTPLVTRTTPVAVTGATSDAAISMVNAIDIVITATGTWSGASLQPQVCEDPTAAVPVWTNSGAALAADGSKTITGPHNAVRAHVTGGGVGTALALTFAQRKPVALA